MSLTDDDKGWLQQILGQFEKKFDLRFDQQDQKIAQLDARISQMDAKFYRLLEQVEAKIDRVETSLLTEFHKWASPIEARIKSHSAALRA